MSRKNILFLFPDQHRADWMPKHDKLSGSFQHNASLDMPTLRGIMDKGFVFTNAMTPSPLCAPARSCLAFGSNYQCCDVPNNLVNLPEERQTFYNVLKDNGYHVLSCGKLDVHKGTKFWGENGWVESLEKIGFTNAIDNEGKIDTIIGEMSVDASSPSGMFSRLVNPEKEHRRGPYINYLYGKGLADYHIDDMNRRNTDGRDIALTELDDDSYCDNWLTQNGIDLLEKVPNGEPWFLQVNFTGPHDPWDITASMKERVKGLRFDPPIQGDERFEEKDLIIRSHYTAMLENIDDNIKKLLDTVEKRGELENTIIIYSSDHGEMLGEFGKYGKCVPNRGSVNIPLIISGSEVPEGKSCAMVQLQDISTTILSACGLEHQPFPDSHNLLNIAQSKLMSIRDAQVSALAGWYCINDTRYKLMVDKDNSVKLYDIVNDPLELNDISSENQEIVNELKDKYQMLNESIKLCNN